MSIEIKSVTGRVLYTSGTAKNIFEALEEAIRARANLANANLAWAKLTGADLTGANLANADLANANLACANLTWAALTEATILSMTGLPSGHAVFMPTPEGWSLRVGCWTGTLQQFRDMINGTDWPEATGAEQDRRRPGLLALALQCDSHMALWPNIIDELADTWETKPAQPIGSG